jgi:hypothetical protein
MAVTLTDEQAKNWAATLRNASDAAKNMADLLDPPQPVQDDPDDSQLYAGQHH